MSIIVIAVAVLVGCFAQAAAGTGLGLIAGGTLVSVLGREPSIMLLTLISVPMMLAVGWQNRAGIHWSKALIMGGTALVLSPPLAIGLRALNQSVLMIVCGVLILVSVALLYFGFSSTKLVGKRGAVLAGSLTSLLNMLSGTGGPPAAIYAVNSGWDATTTRGTLQVVFFMVGVGTVASLGVSHWEPEVVIAAAGAALMGTVAGMLSAKRVPAEYARLAILALATLGGFTVLGSGIGQLAA